MSKYKGIDRREIKCCDESPTTIEAGLSFDFNEGQNILNFHFLSIENGLIKQETKSMWLDKKNTSELISELKKLKFKIKQ